MVGVAVAAGAGDQRDTLVGETSLVDTVGTLVPGEVRRIGDADHGGVGRTVALLSKADVGQVIGRFVVRRAGPRAVGAQVLVEAFIGATDEEAVVHAEPLPVLEEIKAVVEFGADLFAVVLLVVTGPVVLEDRIADHAGGERRVVGRERCHRGGAAQRRRAHAHLQGAAHVATIEAAHRLVHADEQVEILGQPLLDLDEQVVGLGVDEGVGPRPTEGAAALAREFEEAGAFQTVLLVGRDVGAGAHTLEARALAEVLTVFKIQCHERVLERPQLEDRGDEVMVGLEEFRLVTRALDGARHPVGETQTGVVGGTAAVEGETDVIVGPETEVHLVAGAGERGFGQVVDDAAEVADAVEQGGGTADDLDAADVAGVGRVLPAETVA